MKTIKENYDLKMIEQLKNIEKMEHKPKLLLHTCCAPCSSTVIETLLSYFEIDLFFYNPNITEKDEYYKRLEELKGYTELKKYSANIYEGRYLPTEDFFQKIKGLEHIKEGGERCRKCYELRMNETARFAKEQAYDYFTTALSISPMKNSAWINEIGENLEKKYGVKFLYGDFKKKGRYLETIKISKEYNMYRQDFCGCIFSKLEMEEHRKNKMFKENEGENNE